jgi:hypothetical protein
MDFTDVAKRQRRGLEVTESTHDRPRSLNESRGRSISPPKRASTVLTTERDCALDHDIVCNRLLGLPWNKRSR